MPQEIKEHRFGNLTRRRQYEQYFDGKIWQWSQEELEEYTNGAESLRSSLYAAARRFNEENEVNLRIRTQIVDGSLIMQATEEEE